MARRLLSIWFPRLASDVSRRHRPVEGPFALTRRSGQVEELHCLDAAARAAGLHRGMPLADARAVCPALATRPAEPLREAAALEALRRWASRYGPHADRDGADGLIVDASGVPHLFGGEPALLDDLGARLERAGIGAVSAIAETRGAAWALARHGGGVIPEGGLAARLGPLPVTALRLPPEMAEGLARLGLQRVADLMGQPRAPLARRFGPELLRRLDQAMGQQAEPVAAPPAPPHFGVRMSLPEPIGLVEDVMAATERLLGRLCEQLAAAQSGARRVRLELRRVDRSACVIEAGLARPMREPARIAALLRRRVEAVDAGFGIDGLRVSAVVAEPMRPAQLDGRGQAEGDGLADLLSRLGNRLGFEAVRRFQPTDSLIPERSFVTVPYASSEPVAFPPHRGPERPLLIFRPEPLHQLTGNPPSRFRWRGSEHVTLRAIGPERIAPEWWHDDPAWRSGLRDYWRIETCEGPRLWLFSTPQAPAWYVQGIFE